jgi:hypothetical protein
MYDEVDSVNYLWGRGIAHTLIHKSASEKNLVDFAGQIRAKRLVNHGEKGDSHGGI